ncbi:MAG: alpha-xylosidase [Polyangiaceae bacterium]
MRFGDGAWRMLPGVNPSYLSRVDGVRIEPREVSLDVSSRVEKQRWDTLFGHMFTLSLSSPAPNVVRVRVTHHKGRRKSGPDYVLQNDQPQPVEIMDSDKELSFVVGALRVIVNKEPFGLRFVDAQTGAPITSSPFKAMGMMQKDGGLYMREQLTLRPGEQVYGLGERFQAFTRNGQSVDMWNDDCGTCSDKGYKDVPFFMTSKGYGVFVNSSARVSFEIGTEQVARAQFALPGEDLEYFLIYGPTPKDVLTRYGALTGRPALPPAWSFGLWLTTSFVTNYDEATVNDFVNGMRERKLPLHVFHFDCFWMKAHHWVNFRWDESTFPDPEGMLSRLKAQGLKICVWINPYIGERSHLFDEGNAHGFLLKRPNGDVHQVPTWQAGMAVVDFTNPHARAWYQAELRRLLRQGVDCFKTDFGELIPTDVAYHDGSDPERMHNYYTYLYNKAVFDVLSEERGRGEALVFARSATATCQQFPVHWGGDCYGTFESMAESLRGGLSLTLCGFGFWSHDIGGFESTAPAAVYKRWIGFGLLSTHSRLHGNSSYRVPWLYDEESVEVLRRFTQLKCRLMPYLMRGAVTAHEQSVPLMRAMLLEYPNDPACHGLDRQYFLGDDLLVAPVFHESEAEYYLPAGEWTHLLSGEVRAGGSWVHESLGYLDIPLWIRPNGVIPLGPELEQVDYDYAARVRLVCGRFDDGASRQVEIADARGESIITFQIERRANAITVTSRDGRKDFEVQLPWLTKATKLEHAEAIALTQAPGDSVGVAVRAQGSSVRIEW